MSDLTKDQLLTLLEMANMRGDQLAKKLKKTKRKLKQRDSKIELVLESNKNHLDALEVAKLERNRLEKELKSREKDNYDYLIYTCNDLRAENESLEKQLKSATERADHLGQAVMNRDEKIAQLKEANKNLHERLKPFIG